MRSSADFWSETAGLVLRHCRHICDVCVVIDTVTLKTVSKLSEQNLKSSQECSQV